jgi:hypothetical protein
MPAAECPNPDANTLVICGTYMGYGDLSTLTDEGMFLKHRDENGTAFQIMVRGSNRKKTFCIERVQN